MRIIQCILLITILSVLLAGCGGKDYTYQSSTEDNPGPGLLSGDDGEFNLIKSTKKDDIKDKSETQESSN